MQYESEHIQFKSQMLEGLYKEVVAFANTEGGIIYIGIDNQGNVTGIDNIDDTYTRITNGIRDAIQPELTFEEAKAAFARYHTEFSESKYITLGMQNPHDGQYTNLAWLLSRQCRHTTKVAVFGDDANTIFKDAKEFSGSLFS